MDYIAILDGIGIFVFAISGVLTAIDKGFDVVGASIIGMVTALGGGTLRDVMIGETPVAWMQNQSYLIIIFFAILSSYLFKNRIMKLKKSMFVFDTIGIGLFTVLGLEKTLYIGLDVPVALLMGIVTAVFGGVLRDVLCAEIPLIFRKEIYASACLAGGLVFLLLTKLTDNLAISMAASMLTVFIIRYFSIKRKWSLNFRVDKT
jgi:uncharacterized membrane protein YeiH|tara:strand:+ start:25 stop:636 length:612 start_codon:yes stop_codon:yes gene_type:complete